jgi:uncharacterized protein YbjT (DUF2867 family)
MEINKLNILVTGATGKQGGATARHLLKAGVKVSALTRKPESKRALALKAAGATIIKGNLNDPESLLAATKGVDAVFCVTNFWEVRTGKKEVDQNKNLCDASVINGVKHFVLASISRCDDNPDLLHFITKYECEKYIQNSRIPYTFLRAVYFMDNLIPADEGAGVHWTFLQKYVGAGNSLQMISTEDVGWFAAEAIIHPEIWMFKTIDLAGDEVNYSNAYLIFQRVFKTKPKKAFFLLKLITLFSSHIRNMFEWYREPRFKANINNLRQIHPGLMNLEDYFTFYVKKINSNNNSPGFKA